MSSPDPGRVPTPDSFEEPVVVYVSRWCGYCRAALRLLESRGVRHATVDVTGNGDARAWLQTTTGRHTVPQIFIHGDSIGGFDELRMLDREGRLP
jgi:glutaredoxin 3